MSDKTSPQIRFHYIKSPAFHTLHADGVIGGLTPRAHLHAAFYVERLPIPNQTVHPLNEDGTLGAELREHRVVKEGVVRELLVDVAMDLDVAARLHEWLGKHLELAKKQGTEAREEAVPAPSGDGGRDKA